MKKLPRWSPPSGITGEEITRWILHGNPGTPFPPDGPPDDKLALPMAGTCSKCGFPNGPEQEGFCHRLICGE